MRVPCPGDDAMLNNAKSVPDTERHLLSCLLAVRNRFFEWQSRAYNHPSAGWRFPRTRRSRRSTTSTRTHCFPRLIWC